jgi:ATP-binding cassette subfamily C protein
VSFTYHSSTEQVLRNLNLEIPLGSSLGIVGPSGAGKSTLIDLLLGLSVPTGGSIDIDGVPLTDVIHSWRDRVGYVPQRVALFDGSIAQNVALTWDDDFNRDKVIETLERAQLGALVDSREGGIDAKIGERGFSLSGGQQQMLALGRILAAKPRVILADELSLGLAPLIVKRLLSALRSAADAGTAVLLVEQHVPVALTTVDRACVLVRGKIALEKPAAELRKTPEAITNLYLAAG